MKTNTRLVEKQIRDRLNGICLSAIITEAFINSLPLNKENVNQHKHEFANYSASVIKRLHPETLLDRAIEQAEPYSKGYRYLTNLKSDIDEVVDSAMEKISLDKYSSPDVLNEIKLDKEDVKKLVKASKSSNSTAVSKIVKDKVIKTIKNEKDAYEKAEKVKEDIKDMILDADKKDKEKEENTEDEISIASPEAEEQGDDKGIENIPKSEAELDASTQGDAPEKIKPEDAKKAKGAVEEENIDDDSALDSYLRIVLDPTDAREHVSFFSKLQDTCMESLIYSTEEYDEVPFKTMKKITLESTLPIFDNSNVSINSQLESLALISEGALCISNEEKCDRASKCAQPAFISSICILSLLETLKTTHLINVTIPQVRDFVDSHTLAKSVGMENLTAIESYIDNTAKELKNGVKKEIVNEANLEDLKKGLTSLKNNLNNIKMSDRESEKRSSIINKIDDMIAYDIPATESNEWEYRLNRYHEENLAALEHAIKLITNRPNVYSARIAVESYKPNKDVTSKFVTIDGYDRNNNKVCDYGFNINAHSTFGSTLGEIIMESASYTDIGNKPIYINYINEGYMLPLKK